MTKASIVERLLQEKTISAEEAIILLESFADRITYIPFPQPYYPPQVPWYPTQPWPTNPYPVTY